MFVHIYCTFLQISDFIILHIVWLHKFAYVYSTYVFQIYQSNFLEMHID